MLPKGSVRHAIEGNARFLAPFKIERSRALSREDPLWQPRDTLAYVSVSDIALYSNAIGLPDNRTLQEASAECFDRVFPDYDGRAFASDSVELAAATGFSKVLFRLSVVLLLIMTAHPELIEPGVFVKRVKAKRPGGDPRDWWTPNFMGPDLYLEQRFARLTNLCTTPARIGSEDIYDCNLHPETRVAKDCLDRALQDRKPRERSATYFLNSHAGIFATIVRQPENSGWRRAWNLIGLSYFWSMNWAMRFSGPNLKIRMENYDQLMASWLADETAQLVAAGAKADLQDPAAQQMVRQRVWEKRSSGEMWDDEAFREHCLEGLSAVRYSRAVAM